MCTFAYIIVKLNTGLVRVSVCMEIARGAFGRVCARCGKKRVGDRCACDCGTCLHLIILYTIQYAHLLLNGVTLHTQHLVY